MLAVSDVAQAEAEGLTLLKADNKTGYFGVYNYSTGAVLATRSNLC